MKNSLIPDSLYLRARYRFTFRKKLNLNQPKTFNEKLQWLKLYDRKPIYTTMVDKLEVKNLITARIGGEYVIPTLGIWEKFEDIDFNKLPQQFVLKCTHDSGSTVICTNKAKLDINYAQNIINDSLRVNYYLLGREWPYKNVKHQIIAEQYMVDMETQQLRDYKFFCFNGKVKCFKIDFNRFVQHRANYFNREKKLLPFGEVFCPPDFSQNLKIPHTIDEMIGYAEKLSIDIPFIRVDFYHINGKVYFSELTLYPTSGFGQFTDNLWDYTLGNWIDLPSK